MWAEKVKLLYCLTAIAFIKKIFWVSHGKLWPETQPPKNPNHIYNFISGDNLSPVTKTLAINTKLRVSPRIFVKMWNGHGILMSPGGNWCIKKSLKTKISRQTHFIRRKCHPVVNIDAELWTRRAGPRTQSRLTYYVSFKFFNTSKILGKHCWGLRTSLTLIRMTKDEKVLAVFKGLLL